MWCTLGVGKINPAQLLTPPRPLTRLWQQEQRWRPLTATQKFLFPNSWTKIKSPLVQRERTLTKAKQHAFVAAMALIWALWRVQKFNCGHFFRKCSTSSCACAVPTTIFVGLPTPASTANLFPVCEWTQPWRLTRYWRHFEVLLTLIFNKAKGFHSCSVSVTFRNKVC